MALTLSVLRCPDAVPPETRQVSGGEFSIGRGPDNNWTLPDPDRTLSRRHCVLAYRAGGWQLADVSANGTFLNRDADPIGAGAPRELRDGDRLRLGAYEIEVRVVEDAAWQPGGGGRPAAAASAFGDPFGDDPFAPARPAARGFDDDPLLSSTPGQGGFGHGAGPGNVMLPADYDPLAPDPLDAPFKGPTQSDHSSAMEQAFRVPAPPSAINFDDWDIDLNTPPAPPAGHASPPPPAPPPASALDDWDIDLSPPPAPSPPPVVAAPPPPPMPPPVAPIASSEDDDDVADPFAEPERDAAPARMVPPPPPMASPVPPPAPPPTPPPVRAAAVAAPRAPTGDLMAAFMHGAGMGTAQVADPEATMQQLGAAFRALVSGIRQALIARAAIKGEFRIEQTMIRARGNNPLKFSADDDDALAALLGTGRRIDMTADAAVSEALTDMRLHELASMAAMQTAVRALVERFDPAPLRAEGERAGGLLGAQKRARAFELYEKLHGDTARALADDFDSVFGKAFARAYEQALREVTDKERDR